MCDITTTTAYRNLQRTGYENGVSLRQDRLLDQISDLEELITDYEGELEDTDKPEYWQDKLEHAQGQLDWLWREYYESKGVA